MSDYGLFSSYESQQGEANGQDSWGVFQGNAQDFGRLDAGCWLARRLHQLNACTTMDLGITISLFPA